jgi:DNA-binding IclR family transcriptional regulator
VKIVLIEKKRYWVPALEKANLVLQAIAGQPENLKLIDLSKQLNINKSSLFSLLHTLEELQWVKKEKDDTYSLGTAFSGFYHAFIQHFDFQAMFQIEAEVVMKQLEETIQIAKLEADHILYIGKVEASTPVRLLSEPGMRLPAYATSMGKMMLSSLSTEELDVLFPNDSLKILTPHTISSKKKLIKELKSIRDQGFSLESQEAVMGFCCVAAPIINRAGKTIFSVSCSMPIHQWESKKELAKEQIVSLALKLSNMQ